MATETQTEVRERKWLTPSKRASGYAEELRSKVHMYGKKKGEPLTDTEITQRRAYLFCQSDHAGSYKYHQAIDSGLSKAEARRLSKIIGKEKKKNGKENKQ